MGVAVFLHNHMLGVWFGVEWDDLSRGRHSGEHEGVQYFTCKYVRYSQTISSQKSILTFFFTFPIDKLKWKCMGHLTSTILY